MKYYPNTQLNTITKKIVDLMPPLEQFFLSEDNIFDNSKKLYSYSPTKKHQNRQKGFIELIQNKIKRIFSKEELKSIKLSSLEEGLKSGVVDHHGILNHPVLIGVNIVPYFFKMFDKNNNGDILAFATGNVPLDNFFNKRGFILEGKKVNIFPKSDKNKITYGLPKYNFPILKHLQTTKQLHLYSSEAQKFLNKIQLTIDSINFSECNTLGDQITKINFYLWPLLFDKKIRDKVSNLISLEYDDIVIEYLLFVLNNDKESFIYKILFDIDFRNKALVYFEGKTGAWDEKNKRGTHFFWGLDDKNRHQSMQLVGDKLIGNNYKIYWNLESITKALNDKKILPGMFLKFSLILFYMGLKPFAGYGSANYLAVLQKNMVDFLKKDYPEEIRDIKNIAVNNLTSVPVLLRKNNNKEIENFFAFDIILNGGLTKDYFKKINSIPLKYFMTPNLNDIYEYAFKLYGKGKKDAIKISSKDYKELLFDKII